MSKLTQVRDLLVAGDEAKENGWSVISMRDDWKRIFAFDRCSRRLIREENHDANGTEYDRPYWQPWPRPPRRRRCKASTSTASIGAPRNAWGRRASFAFITQNGWELNVVNDAGEPSRGWV